MHNTPPWCWYNRKYWLLLFRTLQASFFCEIFNCMALTVLLACQAPCMLCVCVCVCEVFVVVMTHLQSMRSCVDSPALLPPPCPWRRPRAGSEGHCKPSTSTSTLTSIPISTAPTSRQLSHTLPHTAVSATHTSTHCSEGYSKDFAHTDSS